MFICEMFESKAINPDLYGEELPLATVKQVVAGIMSKVDPHAHIAISSSPEGYYIARITNASQGKNIKFDFGITADGGEITANIVNAYSNYKGAGVVTSIVGECFKAAERLWGKPSKFVISVEEDRGHGVWQAIAKKLGAEFGGSVNEISDDLRRSYLDRAGKHVDRRLDRIARVRDRLNKGYEIYHADRPTNGNAIVDRFEADTPALAQQYYEKFIRDYNSDVDFDLQLRRATGIMEVTMVNTQSRSKRQHTDVLPNDGKPIPKGQEAEHLGELTAEMPGGYQLWSWTDRGTTTYYVFDPETRTSQLGTSGRAYPDNRNSFVIMGTYSGPKNQYRAADLYAFLIFGRGLTLVSDNKQSTGGYRVWQELERNYGRRLNIHGFDTKTNKPVNVTTQDEPDTHVARSDVKKAGPQMKKELGSISRDLRFVASAR